MQLLKYSLLSISLLIGAPVHARLLLKALGLCTAYQLGKVSGVYEVYFQYNTNQTKFIKHKQRREELDKKITELSNLSPKELSELLAQHPELYFLIERILRQATNRAIKHAQELIDKSASAQSSNDSKS